MKDVSKMTDYERERYYAMQWAVPEWGYFVGPGVVIAIWVIAALC